MKEVFLALIFNISTLLLSPQVYSMAFNCSHAEQLRVTIIRTNDPRSVQERAQLQIEKWDFVQALSKKIYTEYFNGSLKRNFLNECIEDQKEKAFLTNTLPKEFLQKSLMRLKNSRSSLIKKLAIAAIETLNSNHVLPFKFIGHMKENTNNIGMQGGFHRGHQSIFMDFTMIPPNDWFIILSHELIHSIDPFLKKAVINFADPEIGKLIIQWNNETTNPDQLHSEDKKRLYTWLKAGLDRGLVAEYRAWVLTFQIYQEGLKEDLWKPIVWMEEILSLNVSKAPLKDFLYDFLEKRFVDPSDWNSPGELQSKVFLLPLIKNAIADIRNEYRSSKPSLIPLK